ncbi:gliding motility-associated C-terminal domain [Sphingobacterium spiritivorum]|uniref:Gliding motility-associated C-terminal domain n=1 Tax=Sphingobacterium spiritivorum TaxID=258 RepID=A0A380BI24_SPHSI|nr:MBG domain-containing protein [Sphingobacterium spiritivorum]SUJ01322.1 gliding motility-associated C-terminal domain [Sphingobacterium spiritivorum]
MKSSNYYNNILKSIKSMRMGVLLFLLSCILFIGKAWGQTEITETFESAVAEASTFTSGGKTFTIISAQSGPFDIQSGYPGFGWSGTANDNKFIDNDGAAAFGQNTGFSIKIDAGLTYSVKKFYLFLADHNAEQYTSGTVTVTGKLAGATVFTATTSTGFVQSTATNNGFTPIDLTTFGGVNNSTKVIDELEISTTHPFNYVCMDALTWKLEYTCPTITIDTPTHINVACKGTATGSVTVAPSGGTAPYTYSWTLGAGTAATASNLTAGTYTVTVTDKMGCTATKTITIVEPVAALAGIATKTDISCFGGSNGTATVAVTGGTGPYAYSWAPSGGTGASATGLAIGSYTVTVTDANACQITRTVTVGQPAAALAGTATQTNVSCFGGSNGTATVAVTGGTPGYTYSWAPSGGTNATATGLATGTYTVTVTDANACQITRTVTVGQPAAALSGTATQTDVSCFGGNNGTATVAVTGGTPGYTYSWAPSGGTGATATGLAAGNYTVTITDANACQITRTVTVGQPAAALSGNATKTDISCFGGSNGTTSVAVTGGTAPYTYSWSPSGGTAASATGLGIGTYTVTVKDANSCQITRSVTIGQPAAALAGTTSKTDVSCFGGSNGTASIAVTGGTTPYTYSWSPSGGTAASASGLAAGTYTVTVTDANACQITRNVTVGQPAAALSATATKTDVSCNGGSNGTATVSVTGGTPGYTYSWAPTGGTAASATGLAAGTYTVTVTDANACQTTATVTVDQPDALTGNATKTDVSCFGGSNGTATIAVTGGKAPYTYSWSPSGGTAASATGLGIGTYTVTVKDANSCQITRSVTIGQPAAALAGTTSKTDVSCFGGSNGTASIAVTGGTTPYTYSWSPSGGTAASASGLAAGTYTVTVTDANACQITSNVTVGQPAAALSGTATKTDVSCNGGSNGTATVSVTGGTPGYTYSWAPSGGTAASATGLAAGTYTVTIKDANLCMTTATVTVGQPAALAASFSTTDVSCNGGSNGSATVTVTGGTGAYTYSWAPSGGTAASATGLSAGTYTVTITDANACQVTSSVTVNQPSATVTVFTADAVDVAAQTVTLGGNVPNGLCVIEKGIVYGINALPTTSDTKKISSSSSATFTVDISGLTVNTLYRYRAYAIVNGVVSYGAVKEFTTFKYDQQISFNAIASKIYGDASFDLGDTHTDRGLLVTYTAADPTIVSITGNHATILKSGNTLITATQAGNQNNNAAPPVSRTLTVGKAALTVTADEQSKVYGSNDPALTYTVTGMVNNDAATVVSGNLKRESGENIGTYAITDNNLTAANYTISYLGNILTISKANLTVTADAQSKVYGASDPALTYKVTGLVNNDAATVVTGTLKREIGENIGAYAILDNDLTAANYTITYTGANLTITKANLTVTADAQNKIYGASDPVLTYKVTGLVNNDAATVVTGTLKRAIGENTGTYAISNNNLTAANYTITYTGADLTITKANLTVTADAKTKVYGTADPALTYKVTGLVNNDAAAVVTGTLERATGENVGTYAISNNDLTASNYTITYAGANLTITKANLTVTADAKTKVYGTADPALTYKVTGMVNNDAATVVSGTLKRAIGENIGTYAILDNDLTASNYTITYAGANLTITKANLTVTADAKTKVYGTSDPALTYKVTGLVNNDAVTVVTGTLNRATGENIGTYAISNNNLTASNYTISYTGANLTITKANLTVTADAKTKVYGTNDPALTYKVTGLVNNDASTVVTGTLKRAVGENIGSYAISNNDLTASNYLITYAGADLTITKANLTVTADAKTKVYGTNDPAFTYKVTGLVNNDASTVVTGTLKRAVGENVGTYAISNNDLTASNYTITYAGADLTISKANLTVTADAKTKVYGTNDPALTYKVTGLVNNDASTVVTGTLKRAVGENVGTYAISNNDLTASNYTITYAGANLTISKATISGITLSDGSFTYDATAKSILIAGTLPAGTTVSYTGNNQTAAGTYAITATIDGGVNYTNLTLQATLRINKAKQVITFKEIPAVYRDAGTLSLDISSNSPLPIKIYSDNILVAEVTGNQEVTVRGVGLALIRAEQSGDGNYIAADAVTRELRVRNEDGAKLPVRVHPAVSPNGDGINDYLRIEGIDEYPENKIGIFDANGNLVQELKGYDNHSNRFDGYKESRAVPAGTYFYMLEVKINGKWVYDKGFFVVRY